MLSYKESLKILKDTNALLEGHFILSSGLRSSQYIQCAKLLSKPQKAKDIWSSLAMKHIGCRRYKQTFTSNFIPALTYLHNR